MSKAEKPSNARKYERPEDLYRFLERFPCGPEYVRRNADMIREKYPDSWPKMRPRLLQIYQAEKERVGPPK